MQAPNNETLERCLIASCFADPVVFAEVEVRLRAEMFFSPLRREIFRIMSEHDTNDFNIVLGHCPGNERDDYVREIGEIMSAASVRNVTTYAAEVIRLYQLRRIISESNRAMQAASQDGADPNSVLSRFDTEVMAAMEGAMKSELVSIREILPDVFTRLEKYQKGEVIGIKTGLVDLDRQTGGLEPGQLVIIAGRPSAGKSSLAANMALYVAKSGRAVVVFSIEDSRVMLVTRMLCSEASISMHTMRSGKLPRRDYPKISVAAGPLAEAPIYIDDSTDTTPRQIMAKLRLLSRRIKIGLIVVDYIQLMSGESRADSRNQELSAISRGLKKLCKEFSCPLLMLSQLSREVEKRRDPTPVLSDLRDSGALEQDADMVLFTHRPCKYDRDADPTLAQIIIGKQKNGPTGVVDLVFDESTMTFRNRAHDDVAVQEAVHFASEM